MKNAQFLLVVVLIIFACINVFSATEELHWGEDEVADYYRVEISTDPYFENKKAYRADKNSFEFTYDETAETYYIRVAGVNVDEEGNEIVGGYSDVKTLNKVEKITDKKDDESLTETDKDEKREIDIEVSDDSSEIYEEVKEEDIFSKFPDEKEDKISAETEPKDQKEFKPSESEEYYFSLAIQYYRTGNLEKAKENYKKLKELNPNYSQKIIVTSDFTEIEIEGEKFLYVQPDNNLPNPKMENYFHKIYLEAYLKYQEKSYSDAINIIGNQLLKNYPFHKKAYLLLSKIYSEMGNKKQSEKYYEIYRKLD